jgi:hypothetical protein
MSTPPKKVNSSETREVTEFTVFNALDEQTKRQQLNRILKHLEARLTAIDGGEIDGGDDDEGVTDHGSLTGLGSDDHHQYYNSTRLFTYLMATLLPQSGVDFEEDAGVPEILLFILTTTGTATEALTAGRFVNLDASGEVQHADCSSTSKLANGFVLSAYADGATNVRVYYGGENTGLSGLTAGDNYYLSTAGQVTATPPTTASYVVQQLGTADSATSLLVNIQQGILRPVS